MAAAAATVRMAANSGTYGNDSGMAAVAAMVQSSHVVVILLIHVSMQREKPEYRKMK
jgi:hypothetical protein